LIRDSRDFCVHRNNKVFSLEEIEKFATPEDKFGGYSDDNGNFHGKPENYSPIEHLGGDGCRHRLDFISVQLAYRLRPELRPTH